MIRLHGIGGRRVNEYWAMVEWYREGKSNRRIRIKTCTSATLSNCSYVTFCIVVSFCLFFTKISFPALCSKQREIWVHHCGVHEDYLFRDVTSNSLLNGLKCFGRKYCLYLHDSTHRTVILIFKYSFPTEQVSKFHGSFKHKPWTIHAAKCMIQRELYAYLCTFTWRTGIT